MTFEIKLIGMDLLSSTELQELPPDSAANVADFAKANALLDKGELAEAAGLALEILALRPVNVVTVTNTVLLLREAGMDDMAAHVSSVLLGNLNKCVADRPGDVLLRVNVALVLIALDDMEAADAAFREVLTLDPLNQSAVTMLATDRLKAGDPDGAIAAWQGPFAANPRNGEVRLTLARRLADFGFRDHAKLVLDLAEPLLKDKSHKFRYIADGIRGINSPKDQAAMTVEIFDGFSKSYDTVLKGIGNRGPDIVRQILQQLDLPRRRKLRILDAGCGTGLCAPLLRPLAKRLYGCDLSVGMLAEAKKKKQYDVLTRSDLASLFTLPEGPFDLIVTSDVLVYFDDLSGVISNFSKLTGSGGWLILTVEDAGEPGPLRGWELGNSGRHRHSLTYLNKVLIAAGYGAPKSLLRADLRSEFRKPVPGLALAAQKLSLVSQAKAGVGLA